MVLMKPELDQWKPGEHTGTFRGNNLAFVAASEVLSYWENDNLSNTVHEKGQLLKEKLMEIRDKYSQLNGDVRGRGMIQGLKIPSLGFCSEVTEEAFANGLLIELAGANDNILKLLPPLTTENELLNEGLEIIDNSINTVLENRESMFEDVNNDR